MGFLNCFCEFLYFEILGKDFWGLYARNLCLESVREKKERSFCGEV